MEKGSHAVSGGGGKLALRQQEKSRSLFVRKAEVSMSAAMSAKSSKSVWSNDDHRVL